MKIISWLGSLLKNINKDQVLEDLRITKTELNEIAKPIYGQAALFFRSNKFKSDEAKDLEDVFYQKFNRGNMAKQTNFLVDIERRLENLTANATYVEDEIESTFESVVYKDGMTARKAILLRSAEHLSFLSRFCLDLLNYIYVVESKAAGLNPEESEFASDLSPMEIKHVQSNISAFAMLLSDYGQDNKEFAKCISTIPDVHINEKTSAAVAATFKEKDLDPFKAPQIHGFIGNPIYHLRLIVTQWQASRYEANKNKKRMLELRLLHLELLKEKKNDPKIEQEIEYNRKRVLKIDRYLREVEESVDAEV